MSDFIGREFGTPLGRIGIRLLPGRKRIALYINDEAVSTIVPLAYFLSEEAAEAAQYWIADLMRRKGVK